LVKSELPRSWSKNSSYLIQTKVSKTASVSCMSTGHNHIYLILILSFYLCLCPQPVDSLEFSWQNLCTFSLVSPKTSKVFTLLRDIFTSAFQKSLYMILLITFLLGPVTKLRKTTISPCVSPSAWDYWAHTERIFIKLHIWQFFENCLENSSFSSIWQE